MTLIKYRVFVKVIADSALSDAKKVKAIRGMLRIQESKEADYESKSDNFRGLFVWGDTKEGFEFWSGVHQEVFR